MKQSSNIPAHFESLYPDTTRFEEIEKIISFVKSGRSAQLIGLPGTGKSNLLGMLSYNKNVRLKHLGENQKWFHFVYMDFSEVRKRGIRDTIKFMLISTAYSLSERGLTQEYEVVNKFLKEGLAFSDELILFQSLKKSIDFLAIEKELTVVFLFDRFDQYLPDLSQQFFLNLKILRNRAKYRFSCLFALGRPLEDMVDPTILSEFAEFMSGNVAYLNIYDPVGLDFRLSYLEKVTGKKTDQATKKSIIAATSGHGKLTRLSYEVILSQGTHVSNLKQFLLDKTVIKNALFEIWNALTPSEKNLLKNPGGQIDGSKDSYLVLSGLFKNGEIAISLFATYVSSLPSQNQLSITYLPDRNELLQGNESITEKLSPSEFRLLRFLLENQGKICEKEEIIRAVWKDSQTQEGVTDQALDQIIYRLRRKIEENPNNPIHLQTIKGRGFKFIP